MRLRSCSQVLSVADVARGRLLGTSTPGRMIPHRPLRMSLIEKRVGGHTRLQHLDLKQARCARPPRGKPRGDPDALAWLAPAELDDAACGVGDQLLGGLVAGPRPP